MTSDERKPFGAPKCQVGQTRGIRSTAGNAPLVFIAFSGAIARCHGPIEPEDVVIQFGETGWSEHKDVQKLE